VSAAEVWFWCAGAFHVYCLGPDGYRRRDRSDLLPDLDVARLVCLAELPEQTQAVRAFRDFLRSGGPSF
jgi:hypothetical protein